MNGSGLSTVTHTHTHTHTHTEHAYKLTHTYAVHSLSKQGKWSSFTPLTPGIKMRPVSG